MICHPTNLTGTPENLMSMCNVCPSLSSRNAHPSFLLQAEGDSFKAPKTLSFREFDEKIDTTLKPVGKI